MPLCLKGATGEAPPSHSLFPLYPYTHNSHTHTKKEKKSSKMVLGTDDKIWAKTPCQVSLWTFTFLPLTVFLPLCIYTCSHPSLCACVPLHLLHSLAVYLSAYSFPKMPDPFCPADCLLLSVSTYHHSLSPSTSFCVLFIRQPIFLYFPSACFTICLHLTPPSWMSAERSVSLESMELQQP